MTVEVGKTYPLSLVWLTVAGAVGSPPSGLNLDGIDNNVCSDLDALTQQQQGWSVKGDIGYVTDGDTIDEATYTPQNVGELGTLMFRGGYSGTDILSGTVPDVVVAINITVVAAQGTNPAIVLGEGV